MLKGFPPFVGQAPYRCGRNVDIVMLNFLGNLSCWIITLILSFRDYISRIVCQNRRPFTPWFALEGLPFWPLVDPSFGLFKQFGNFFDWIVRIPKNSCLISSTNGDCDLRERAEKIRNKGNKFENRQCAGKIWRDKARALAHWVRNFKSIVMYSNLRIEIPLNKYLHKFTNWISFNLPKITLNFCDKMQFSIGKNFWKHPVHTHSQIASIYIDRARTYKTAWNTRK